jgi:hypothetical protein
VNDTLTRARPALGDAIRHHAAGIDIRGVNLSYGTTHVLKNVNSLPFLARPAAARPPCCA